MGRPALDLDGQRFGRLVSTNKTRRIKGETLRLFVCSCGKNKWIRHSNVVYGLTKSCGCWHGRKNVGAAAKYAVLDSYRRNALRRGIFWQLSVSRFNVLTSSQCSFCGRQPKTVKTTRSGNGCFVYNGIDRLDNNRGYTFKNTVACCVICNRAKRDMSLADFKQWIKDVVNANS